MDSRADRSPIEAGFFDLKKKRSKYKGLPICPIYLCTRTQPLFYFLFMSNGYSFCYFLVFILFSFGTGSCVCFSVFFVGVETLTRWRHLFIFLGNSEIWYFYHFLIKKSATLMSSHRRWRFWKVLLCGLRLFFLSILQWFAPPTEKNKTKMLTRKSFKIV